MIRHATHMILSSLAALAFFAFFLIFTGALRPALSQDTTDTTPDYVLLAYLPTSYSGVSYVADFEDRLACNNAANALADEFRNSTRAYAVGDVLLVCAAKEATP